MKKIFTIFLTVCLMAAVLCITAFASTLGLNSEAHEHGAVLSSTSVDSNVILAEGNYYLTEDITLGEITVNGNVNLCLNGYVLTAESITVPEEATLNVIDCGATVHRYQSSESGAWTPKASGDKVIEGGILCSPIINKGTFNLTDGTIVGVAGVVDAEGVAINNQGTATIGANGAVIGNYNGTAIYYNQVVPSSIPAVVYNGVGATFENHGKINHNVALVHTVCNDGGTFTNGVNGQINGNIATSKTDGTAAGGVANYSRYTSNISKFHNYGQINDNTSARSSGGVLNKCGEFTNYASGQINGNVAARHCGGVDNTSSPLNGNEYTGTFFKNYGQVNNNQALGEHWNVYEYRFEGGNGGGIYNEGKATIYNYGEVCGNKAQSHAQSQVQSQGGGIFFNDGSGTLIVGGDSKVTGNTDDDENQSNICVGSGKMITFSTENPLTDKAIMGIYLYNGSTTRANGTASAGFAAQYQDSSANTYFFADTKDQSIKLDGDGEIYLEEHTHDLEAVSADPSTCIEEGNIAHYKCKDTTCGNLFTDEAGNNPTTLKSVTLPFANHNLGAATCTKAPECQQEGCDHTEGTALGHDMGAATCTKAPECKREGCDHTEGTALGHDMSAATCTKAPECQRNGCDHTEGAALGHDMSAATCTKAPECKRDGCDHTEGDALGHDWSGEWIVIKKATVTKEGMQEILCARGCGHSKTETIPTIEITGYLISLVLVSAAAIFVVFFFVRKKDNFKKYVEIAPDAPIQEATFDNSKEELLNADTIFDEDEKQAIQSGTCAGIWLKISKALDVAPSDQDNAEKAAAAIMGESLNITYFDVKLFKQVGDHPEVEISEPGIAIKITITLPSELINSDATNCEYKILRLHEGQNQVDVISGAFDAATGKVSFETDKFSTYAIAYKK